MTKTILIEVSNFGHCNLFDIWCLDFGASFRKKKIHYKWPTKLEVDG